MNTCMRPLWPARLDWLHGLLWLLPAIALLLVAGCTTPIPPAAPAPPAVPPATLPPPEPPRPAPPVPPPAASGPVSSAQSARAYRRDAAGHIYQNNDSRIFKGKLPPLLYAVAVVQVDVDAGGRVLAVNWMRAPRHAPEVMTEIEQLVRQAAPFPAPAKMGRVTYTDTWLWHKSGQFQLDTLTEGQL